MTAKSRGRLFLYTPEDDSIPNQCSGSVFSFRSRQRRNARACCLGVQGRTRLLIGEALALGLRQQRVGPLAVGKLAGVVTEIELREIAVQMGF